jgi:hypothetical protein
MDTNSWVLWVGVIAAGLHVIEEYAEGWLNWANQEIGPRLGVTITPGDFFITNAALIFFALAGAAIGWWAPAVSLAVPALFIINAVFFHMVPSLTGERLTPGTLSAVFIYLPVAAWMYWAAAEDGVLGFGTVVLSLVLGAAFMAYPIAMLVLGSKIGWKDDPTPAGSAGAGPLTDDMQLRLEPEGSDHDAPDEEGLEREDEEPSLSGEVPTGHVAALRETPEREGGIPGPDGPAGPQQHHPIEEIDTMESIPADEETAVMEAHPTDAARQRDRES